MHQQNQVKDGQQRWGDVFTLPKSSSITRCVVQNINGLAPTNSNPANDALRAFVDSFQIDIFGMSETNINWTKVPFHHRMQERTREWWPIRQIHTAHNAHANHSEWHQHGGVALLMQGQLCHHIMQTGSDETGLGRWCWTQIRGRQGLSTRIVIAYRPVLNVTGPLAVYNQHRRYFLSQNNDRCPREQFNIDLINTLSKWVEAGDNIIIGIDMNDDARNCPLAKSLQQLGLYELTTLRGHGTPPPTYQRGSKPIDGLFGSARFRGVKGGYLAFGEGNMSDHRPLWIDIPTDLLYNADTPCATPTRRRLQCHDPRIVNRYLAIYKTLVQQSDLTQRAADLWSSSSTLPMTTINSIWNDIDRTRTQAMLQAEQQCRKFKMGKVQWSPRLQRSIDEVTYWSLILKRHNGGRVASKLLARLKKAAAPLSQDTSLGNARRALSAAKRGYHQLKREATTLRATWLEELALARAKETGGTTAQQLAQLRFTERKRREYSICRKVLGQTRLTGVTMVTATAPTGEVQEITIKEDIEAACLSENLRKFQQAKDTPFLQYPLREWLDICATNTTAQQILEGEWQPPQIIDADAYKLIKALERPQRAKDNPITLGISTEDHSWHWSKAREFTATGTSGLHFGHFKASIRDPYTAELETTMAQIPFATGATPSRWQSGLDLAILKKPGNYQIDALRSLLLLEPDFNYLNKVLGQCLMSNAERMNLLAPEQYGSRRNRSAAEHAVNKRLAFDISRQLRQPFALCSNDAKSCYDRIIWPVASLALQRLGVPIQPLQAMLGTLSHMKHYIRTQYGTSETYYDTSSLPLFHGIGQGNGAAPAIWAAVSSPLLTTLRKEGFGAKFQAPLSGEHTHVVGFAFVDDMDMCQTVSQTAPTEELTAQTQASLDSWSGLLRATGGALVPEKSFWVMCSYKWKNGKWSYATKAQQPGQLYMTDAQGQPHLLDRINPEEGRRTLGVRLAADGSNTEEIHYLRECSVEWASKIRSSHLPRPLIWTALRTILWPKLEYPLPATTLTLQECRHIMAPAIQAGLSASGIVSTLPRVLTHGTARTMGLELPHLYDLQGYTHIMTVVKHGADPHSITGKLIRTSLQVHKVELGLPGMLFAQDYEALHKLTTTSWLKALWKYVWESAIEIQEDTPNLQLSRVHDQFLMQQFIQSGFQGGDLCALNRCRIYLRVQTLSDITTGCGRFITHEAREGKVDVEITRHNIWPTQGPPTRQDWVLWRTALQRLCTNETTFRLKTPLEAWIQPAPLRSWHYSATHDRLYRQVIPNRWVFHVARTSRSGRSNGRRFHIQAQEITAADLPQDLLRGQATLAANAIWFTGGFHTMSSENPPSSHTIRDAVLQCTPGTQWVTSNLTFLATDTEIIQILQQGSGIAVSDGSYGNDRGSASWICASKTGQVWCKGVLNTPGYPEDQSAFRSELSGIYAIVLVIERILSYTCLTDIPFMIGCDSIKALRNCFGERGPQPNWENYDLIMAIRTLVARTAATYTWKHIRGHQPITKYQPKDLWTSLNEQMDKEAKAHRHQPLDETTIQFAAEPWSVWIRHRKLTAITRSTILNYIHWPKGRQYWEKKLTLQAEVAPKVAWEALGNAFREVNPRRRLWALKFASGHCPVGKQMQRQRQWRHNACPRCQSPEDNDHILRCPAPSSTQVWQSTMQQLRDWFNKTNTAPDITETILKHLQHWRDDSRVLGETPPTLQNIIDTQNEIGWNAFSKGFIATEWSDAQQQFLRRLPGTQAGKRWLTQLIKKMWEVSWDMWEHRNDQLHRGAAPRDIELDEEIRSQYHRDHKTLSTRERTWRNQPLETMLSRPTKYRKAWLNQAQLLQKRAEIIESEATRQSRLLMHRWLDGQS